MNAENDLVRVRHMLDAVEEALSFVSGLSEDEFGSDRMRVLASIKELEMIGEAAGRVSVELKDSYPQVPWSVIVSMRNRLIHGYVAVNSAIIWRTLDQELPNLEKSLAHILRDESKDG